MSIKNTETLGRRIARMRLQHAMTQERLANIANVSSQAVSKWENDQSYPDILLLPVLAKTFGVTVDELLGVESPVAVSPVVTELEHQTMPMPEPEPEPVLEPEPVPEPEPTPEPEPAPEPEPEPDPMHEQEPSPREASTTEETSEEIDERATHLRLHVIQRGRDAVNIAIPLVAARLVSNVAGFIPSRIVDGIDVVELARSAQSAGRGTLVDIDDGNDRVIITLE